MRWFDDNYLLYPFGENGILFTSEFFTLKKLLGRLSERDKFLAKQAIESQRVSPSEFRAISEEINSHDNHTGIVCLSYLVGFDYHKRFFWKHWWRRIHPRDIVFYLYLKGGLSRSIASLLMWIPSLAMIISCAQNYKVRNGRRILKTDGKLLAWLRFNTIKMPITELICTWLIKRNKTCGS